MELIADMTNRFLLAQCDAMEFLRNLTAGSVDCVFTDPPYPDLEEHRARGTTTRLKLSKASSNPWFEPMQWTDFWPLFKELYRVLKPGSHCYVMAGVKSKYLIRDAAINAGFKHWNDIVWRKLTKDGSKLAKGMGYHYRRSNEIVMFFEKGKRKLNDFSIPDTLDAPRLRGKDVYPTEKPAELVTPFIFNSTEIDDFVLDPFCGSGVVAEVALRCGCRFTGCDISPDAIERTSARVEGLKH